jgi:hypothetical protein
MHPSPSALPIARVPSWLSPCSRAGVRPPRRVDGRVRRRCEVRALTRPLGQRALKPQARQRVQPWARPLHHRPSGSARRRIDHVALLDLEIVCRQTEAIPTSGAEARLTSTAMPGRRRRFSSMTPRRMANSPGARWISRSPRACPAAPSGRRRRHRDDANRRAAPGRGRWLPRRAPRRSGAPASSCPPRVALAARPRAAPADAGGPPARWHGEINFMPEILHQTLDFRQMAPGMPAE